MSIVGCDASFTRQSGAALAKAGIKSIGRYAGPADPGKTITLEELKDFLSHGISVWLVYEVDVNSWRGGYATGKQHGSACRQWAKANLWWPDDRPIFAAYDTSVGPADHGAFTAYQQGFNDGQGVHAPGAAYADGYVLQALRDLNLIKYTWLSDSSAFPGSRDFATGGNPSIIQYYGRTVPGLSGIDVDECFGDDWGQHPAPSSPPSPAPQPEDTMDPVWIGYVEGQTAKYIIGAGTKHHIGNGDVYKEWLAQAAFRKIAVLERPCSQAFLDDLTNV